MRRTASIINCDLTEGHPRRHLIASIFDPLRHGIASEAQRDRLIKRLIDPTQFNWGKFPWRVRR
jgi:hypothetical protein